MFDTLVYVSIVSTNQSIDQSINQSANQSINESICDGFILRIDWSILVLHDIFLNELIKAHAIVFCDQATQQQDVTPNS